MPHLDAGYNLARWILTDPDRAEDATQDAALKALRGIGSLRAAEPKPWFLAIVRNTCFNSLRTSRSRKQFEAAFEDEGSPIPISYGNPASEAFSSATRESLRRAIESLPEGLREVIVLREIEDMSYREIAEIAGIPEGTVMSRLSRARERLAKILGSEVER